MICDPHDYLKELDGGFCNNVYIAAKKKPTYLP